MSKNWAEDARRPNCVTDSETVNTDLKEGEELETVSSGRELQTYDVFLTVGEEVSRCTRGKKVGKA